MHLLTQLAHCIILYIHVLLALHLSFDVAQDPDKAIDIRMLRYAYYSSQTCTLPLHVLGERNRATEP